MKNRLELLQLGAFPEQIDPWAEHGRYFHQIHAQMITYIIDQIGKPLFNMGYIAGREISLQIAENRQPDIFVEQQSPNPRNKQSYAAAAEKLSLDIGLLIAEAEPELDRVFILAQDDSSLVTVIEIISPKNKTSIEEIAAYQDRRRKLLAQAVHVVEIDVTRSVKRLIEDRLVETYPYHIAIHLHDEPSRFIGIELGEAPKSFALPLRDEVIPLHLKPIYQQSYQSLSIPLQILGKEGYDENSLPFPSLISEQEKETLFEQIKIWQEGIKQSP